MSDSKQIQQWKRLTSAHLEKERHLMQLLVRYARGEVERDVVDQATVDADVLGKLAEAAFQEAFGGPGAS